MNNEGISVIKNLMKTREGTTEETRIDLVITNEVPCVLKAQNYNITKEYNIMSRLNCNYIARPIVMISPNSYLLPYYAEGDLSKRKGMSQEDLFIYFKQICESVEYLHSQNICHLDLKLHNFMLDDIKQIKLIDFGDARIASGPVNGVLGTNSYNAPERYGREYDGLKADIYSLGICMFALLTGIEPFARPDRSCRNYNNFRNNPDYFWKQLDRDLISRGEHPYPEYVFDAEAIELITLMIQEDPEKRPSITDVLKHKYFIL